MLMLVMLMLMCPRHMLMSIGWILAFGTHDAALSRKTPPRMAGNVSV
jgi:hypothetical protein